MTICWDCRQIDGSHLPQCSLRRKPRSRRRAPETRNQVTYARRWSVLSDDDVAWCREQLAARWKT